MKKHNTANNYVTFMGLFLFLALASAVVAVCLQNLFVGIGAAVCLLVYLALAIAAAVKCDDGKSYFLLSWAVMIVSVLFFALMPLTLIVWLVEKLAESCRKQQM